MPNLKIHLCVTLDPAPLVAALPDLRALLCQAFAVAPSACQLVVVPVLGLPDQPLANAELSILPRPERTRALVTEAALALQSRIAAALQTPVAVRISQLDPATYVALK